MFSQIVAVVFVTSTAAAVLAQPGVPVPGDDPKFARIISQQNDLDTTGSFSYSYETENGIKAEARGVLNNAGVPDKEEQVVTGSFSFVDNGKVYSVTYIADANGFRAFGDHIPSTSSSLSSPNSQLIPQSQPPSHQPPHPTLPRPALSQPLSPPQYPLSPPQYPQSPPQYPLSPPQYPLSPPQDSLSPPQNQPATPPLLPRSEVDDLARVRFNPHGLSPPPLSPPSFYNSLHPNPYPAEIVLTPTSRNPRRRQQEFLETIIY